MSQKVKEIQEKTTVMVHQNEVKQREKKHSDITKD